MNRKHGLYEMKRSLMRLGSKALDGRYTVSKALLKWRADLVADLGGEDNVSTQQGAIIELCVKNKLLLDSVDAWLLTQKSLINKRRKSLLYVVKERQVLADSLAKYLSMLGLKRVARELTLSDMIDHALKEQNQPAGNGAAQPGEDEEQGSDDDDGK